MSLFSDLFAETGLTSLLAVHGEQVSYTPASSGDARTITAIVKQSQDRVVGQIIDYDNELIWVTVRRDEDHADGGVEEPARKDTLTRAGDESELAFAYAGRVIESTAAHWVLEFTRPKPRNLGTAHRRRIS